MHRTRIVAGRRRRQALTWVLVVLTGWPALRADEPATQKFPGPNIASRQKPKPAATTEAHVRLNHFRADWNVVLQQLADETGSTLVMPETPPGKFTRTDLARHSREDAVRILNRDLEKLGYRLVANNETLSVVSTRKEKIEYERHVVQPPKPPAGLAGAAPERALEKPLGPVRQVNHEAGEQVAPAAAVTVQTRQRSAIDVAKHIHQTFKHRARLEEAGPNGMPAFVVDHFDPALVKAGKPLFIIEINSERNELVLTGDARVQMGLRQMIHRLDANPLAAAPPRLLAGNGQTAAAGKKLQQPITLIAQAREAEPEGPTDPMVGAAAEAATRQAIPTNQLPALLGRLKGDVTIQSLDDLDLLIIEGNEKDVEAVMQVIQAVEQMAIGSLPEIHLLRLQHVDSQSLAQLLNDMYARLTELRSNNAQRSQVSVRVVPVVTPNAVLVLAPANAMENILDLADQLDQPIDPTHEIQIFRLRNCVASNVVEVLREFYGDTPTGLSTRLKVSADPRTNSVVVQAKPRDLTEIAEFIKGMDAEQASSVSKMQIFPLQSATADELAQFLNSAFQSALAAPPAAIPPGQTGLGAGAGGGGGTTNQAVKAVVLEFLAEDGQQLLRSGLLNDIRFNADPRTNSLVVTAPEQSLPLIRELVTILDRPSSAVSEIKVYPLRNADAASAVTLLNELFGSATTQNQVNQQAAALGITLAGAQASSSNLIPLRFSVDSRTNSVVAIGGSEVLTIVEAILYRLDSNEARNRQTTVVRLRNSPAADIAAAINQFLQSQRDLLSLDPTRISTSQILEQEVLVTGEPVTNSLIISATPTYFAEIQQLALKLDAEPSQVIIQALLVEVELNNTDEFGVELGFQDSVLFRRSIIDPASFLTISQTSTPPGQNQVTNTVIVSQSAVPGYNFNNQPLGSNNGPGTNPGRVGNQGLSNFSVGRTNNDLGYGGLVLSASSESVSVLIRALAARRTLRILSRPQILAVDNQFASIQVGQVVPVTDGINITPQGSAFPIITRDNAGIILSVTPRISPEGQIIMQLAAEKSLYSGQGVDIFTDVNTGNTVTAPIKDITTAQTVVKVPDGQTIVVGGMITKTDDTTERKVPWLGDLPLIGKAFRYDFNNQRRTELLIFLTPRIIHSDADSEIVKQVETGRMHWFQDDAEAIHGPILGVPPMMGPEICPPMELHPFDMEHGPAPVPAQPPLVPPIPEPGLVTPSEATQRSASRGESVQRIGDLPVK